MVVIDWGIKVNEMGVLVRLENDGNGMMMVGYFREG